MILKHGVDNIKNRGPMTSRPGRHPTPPDQSVLALGLSILVVGAVGVAASLLVGVRGTFLAAMVDTDGNKWLKQGLDGFCEVVDR